MRASNVPIVSGPSRLVAVEVAARCAFQTWANLDMTGVETALAARQAENEYGGVSCGIMDQFSSVPGRTRQLIDCRSLAYEPVRIPDVVSLVIADTMARRALAGSACNERVAECTAGLAGLRRPWPELASWRGTCTGIR